jgi:hypothetical protein
MIRNLKIANILQAHAKHFLHSILRTQGKGSALDRRMISFVEVDSNPRKVRTACRQAGQPVEREELFHVSKKLINQLDRDLRSKIPSVIFQSKYAEATVRSMMKVNTIWQGETHY